MIASIVLPWYGVWLPMNAGTLPFWWLVLVWIFGVMIWFARPLQRARLLHFAFFLLVLLPGATMWSFLSGIHELVSISRLVGSFDPVQFMDSLDHALKISGILLATFLLVTLVSAFLYWRQLSTNRPTEQPTSKHPCHNGTTHKSLARSARSTRQPSGVPTGHLMRDAAVCSLGFEVLPVASQR